MIRALVFSVGLLAFLASASAQEITVVGRGHAEVEAPRAFMAITNQHVPLAGFITGAATSTTVIDHILQADSSARQIRAEDSSSLSDFEEETLEMLMQRYPRGAVLEISAIKIDEIEEQIEPFRRYSQVIYAPLAPNRSELQSIAYADAVEDSRQQGVILARGAGLALGEIARIEQAQAQSAAMRSIHWDITRSPEAPLKAVERITLIVTFNASPAQ